MSKELIEQLRDLANCRHDDLSIGYEAADRIEQLEAERDELLALVIRYRKETPLGHQPHMIAHLADEAIAKGENHAKS